MSKVLSYKQSITGGLVIGADSGQELSFFLENNIKNIVFFEPRPGAYKELLNHIASSNTTNFNIQTYNVGLGSLPGKKTLHEAGGGQASSFLKPKLVLEKHAGIPFWDAGEFEIKTLDSYNFGPEYNFLHIDVQGFELEVLKGSVETLGHIDAIDTEVNLIELYEGCVLIGELDNFLSDFNFKRVDTCTNEFGWGDAIYIKE